MNSWTGDVTVTACEDRLRAVDQDEHVLDGIVQNRRNIKAAGAMT
ncbi:hypothetical protein [Rhizobium lusitanum]|uniref:Transposase-like protein n=1 Tax=Rhizobium lusitanum TaxID=293958 RepID=A0A7X0MHT3_9HYPH|nr:hypothetical protein [Rhizobium lusitanum]MBB6489550.1 transposase-like protein [Rhizobium lusitanum]